MPIKDLSETRRLPRIGKIHLGTKDPERGFPRKSDHFIFGDEFKAAVATIYGENPRELDIIIPVEDDEYWCSQYYRSYSRTQGLVCKGTGVSANRKIDTATGAIAHKDTKQIAFATVTCCGRDCEIYKAKGCKEVMNLQFLLPKLPGLGIWQVDTSSVNSIINVNSCAALIRGVFKRVSMIPLKLTLESKEVNNPESGKKQTVYVLNLRQNKTLFEQLGEAAKLQQEFGVLALPPAPDETEEPDDAGEDTEAPQVVEQKLDVKAPAEKAGVATPPIKQVTSDADADLWPPEATPGTHVIAPAHSPTPTDTTAPNGTPFANVGEFMSWCAGHGKRGQYGPTWVTKSLSEQLKKPVNSTSDITSIMKEAYEAIKNYTGWND